MKFWLAVFENGNEAASVKSVILKDDKIQRPFIC